MPPILMASSAYRSSTHGLPNKTCLNIFRERSRTTPESEFQMIVRPGSLKLPDWASAARGYGHSEGFASGKILVVVGTTLKTYDPATGTVGTITGVVSGTDKVKFAFIETLNGTQCGILANGRLYLCNGSKVWQASDHPTTSATLAIGSTTTNVASAAFSYSINGTVYSKGAVVAGTAPGNDVVPTGLYGAVALDINAAGTITAVEAPANATGYATATLAVAALPDVAYDHVRMGYVTASKSDGAFTFGTTALNAANTTVAYTSTTASTAFDDLLTDHGQTGYSDIAAMDQRFLLTYGSRFMFTAALNGASTTALSYYTAEYRSDSLVGIVVVGERALLLGQKTIEPWESQTSNTDPYRRALSLTAEWGVRARDSAVVLAGVLYWVDPNHQVCRFGASGGVEILSNPDLSDALESTAAADIHCFGYEYNGHAFYVVRLPTICMALDAGKPPGGGQYDDWVQFQSLGSDTFRYGYAIRAAGSLFMGDLAGVGFARVHADYRSDHMPDASTVGTPISWAMSGYIGAMQTRRMGPLRLECAKGVGLANALPASMSGAAASGDDPKVWMRRSMKGPNDWSEKRYRSVGMLGQRGKRVTWNQMGMISTPGVTIEIGGSDPVDWIITGVFED